MQASQCVSQQLPALRLNACMISVEGRICLAQCTAFAGAIRVKSLSFTGQRAGCCSILPPRGAAHALEALAMATCC